MIAVIIYKDKEKNHKGFKIGGHAGFAEKGADIVCAAVSVLAQNTVNSIEEFTEDGMVVELEEESGSLELVLTDEKQSPETILLMKSFELGIYAIMNDGNSDYIQIDYKEV